MRQLDDAAAVRENPLVARERWVSGGTESDYHAAPLRLRATILAAVASLAEGNANPHFRRQRAIVARCDLTGEKHTAVAAGLGISLREFYRERRRAYERLLPLIRANVAAHVPRIRPLPSAFELDLGHVANLRLIGSFANAFAQLERLASQAPRVEDGIRALCYAVEIAADIGDDDRARRCYAAAFNQVQSLDDASGCEVHVPMASAFVTWQENDLASTGAAIERASVAATQLPTDAGRHDVRAAISALFARAELGCLLGDPAASIEALRHARSLLERFRYKPVELLGQLFVEFAVVYGMIPGQYQRAIEYALESISAFDHGGLAGEVADAAGVLSGLLDGGGDARNACRFATTAVDLVRGRGNVATLADKLLLLSAAKSHAGDPAQGLKLAREAAALAQGGLFDLRLPLALAEAHLGLGNITAAHDQTELLERRASAGGLLRYAGNATCIRAEIASAQGDAKRAADLASSGLDLLLEYGQPSAIARAYHTCRRLCPDHRNLALAEEMHASLTIDRDALAGVL